MPQTLMVNLEILPEDERDPDPAAVHAFASSALDTLQHEGNAYLIRPLPTDQRGGLAFLFQLVIQGIQSVDATLLAQKDTIDALNGLCSIFATISAPLLLLFKAHKKHSAQGQEQALTVKVKIDGAEIEITSRDVADDERIVQLAERFHALHPQTKPAPKSSVTAQARVPKKRSRPRR